MSGYYDAYTALARPLAGLLASGPPVPGDVLADGQVPEVLTARDVVTVEVAALLRRLLGAGPASHADLRPGHVVTDPAHVLHYAVYAVPASSAGYPEDRPWLTGTGAWSGAARAAATLEGDHERLAGLPGPAAWLVLRDAADLAAALPILDADLAARLPAGHDPARAALVGPDPQALVRVAAAELRGQLSEAGADWPVELLDATVPQGMVLGSPADLPEGMRRLAAILDDHVDHVAAVDVRAVSKVLAAATETILGDPRTPEAVRGPLGEVLAGLRQVRTVPWATVTRPDWRLTTLTTEVYRQLPGAVGPPGGRLPWAGEVPRVVAALAGAVERTVAAGRIAVPRDHLGPGPHRALLWVPLPAGETAHPLLTAVDAARSAALRTRHALAETYAGPAGPARRAATAAGRAAADLRAALADRHFSAAAPTARPLHPALRQGWGERQGPHQGR